jgi:putative ABC transport system permease protein
MRFASLVSDNFFAVAGVTPSAGRAFLPDEEAAAQAQPVAMVSYDFWRQNYAASQPPSAAACASTGSFSRSSA